MFTNKTFASMAAMLGATSILPAMGPTILSEPPLHSAPRRAAKSRSNRMQRTRVGNRCNNAGRNVPHQGAQEIARRLRQITAGQLRVS